MTKNEDKKKEERVTLIGTLIIENPYMKNLLVRIHFSGIAGFQCHAIQNRSK